MARIGYLTVALLLAWSGVGLAADDPPTGAVLVDLAADADGKPWIAEALELNIERDLAGYQRITTVDEGEIDTSICADTRCEVAAYGAAGADIVMVGSVGQSTLWYRLYETWTPALVATGSLEVGSGSTLISLKQQTLRAFRPFLTQGGLLDQKPFLTTAREAQSTPAGDHSRARRAAGGVLAALATLFLLPIAIGLLAIRFRGARRLSSASVIMAAGIAVVAVVLAALVWIADLDVAAALRATEWSWSVGVLGGIAWGWLIVESFRLAFPPLHGLEGVGHRDMYRLISSWFYACLQRGVVLVLYYTPFVLVMMWAGDAMSAPSRTAVIFLTPLACLAARLWVSEWVACLTPYLDDRVVVGEASRDNPWHTEIRHYLMGYVRREGWNIDQLQLRRVLFLPTKNEGIVSWGGGAIDSRVAIDERLLHLALGSLEESAPDESEIEWPNWSNAVIVPQHKAPGRRRRRRPVVRARSILRRAHTHSDLSRRRQLLGQAATLLGYVAPTPPGDLVPLIADDDADLDVVRSLLAEHYPWREADPDEEHDDTDPSNRDFLFGALAREIGVIERRDNRRATLALACIEATRDSPLPIRRAARAVRLAASTVASRSPAIVADAYAALNFAHDHLVQYLYFQHTGDSSRLTTRARPEELERVSDSLLATAGKWSCSRRDRFVLNASTRNRLVWLSRLFPHPIEEPREARLGKIMAAVIALAIIVELGLAVKRGVDYHPVYLERIAEQERRLREARQVTEEREAKRPTTHDQRQEEATDE